MAVSFTSNIGLAKPDGTELAANWARFTELQADNNAIITDKMDVNLITYTPTLVATTTAPVVGAGSRAGQYIDFQGFIMGQVVVKFADPGIGTGSGEFGVSLPLGIDTTYHATGTAFSAITGQYHTIGEGYIRDDSSVDRSGTCAVDCIVTGGVSYARLITETFVGKTSRVWSSGMPMTLANSDSVTFNFFYKKA
jgi:hypothetical protein